MDTQESVNLAEDVNTLNSILRGEEHEKMKAQVQAQVQAQMQAQVQSQVQAQMQAKIDAMNLETARRMKKDGMSIAKIIEYTKLPESTVAAL